MPISEKQTDQLNDYYDDWITDDEDEPENESIYKWLGLCILLFWLLSFFVNE